LPYIIEALPPDMLLCVTDGKNYLQVAEGEDLKIGITVGSQVLPPKQDPPLFAHGNLFSNLLFLNKYGEGVPLQACQQSVFPREGFLIERAQTFLLELARYEQHCAPVGVLACSGELPPPLPGPR